MAWIHPDLAGDNVFLSGSDVAFIDLTGSWIGPAPFAAVGFIDWCRRAALTRQIDKAGERRLREAYLFAWSLSDRRCMRRAWPAIEVVADVARAHQSFGALSMYSTCENGQALTDVLTNRVARRLFDDIRRHRWNGFAS
jgi:hypothetical protein